MAGRTFARIHVSPVPGFTDPRRVFPHRFPFTTFRASAVGYVVTSLRECRRHRIVQSPMMR
jgi:hypothetical protein